ncbi:MAG: hydrogenase formation protein HypD [Pseudomonadota bacterium]|jgi:hydrogenase expression/formation protein HypD
MKYVDEFRDGALAARVAAAIAAEVRPDRRYAIMEFCGGHTHAICRYGLEDRLPPGVELIHGPGCPVCVLPIGRLEMAIQMALRHGVILCTYGDMIRVPGKDRRSLLTAKAAGADIRMVYGSLDALRIARANPDRQVVFFAIGFETTTPTTAAAVIAAAAEDLGNFSVFCNHVLTPSAIAAILDQPEGDGPEGNGQGGRVRVDAFIGPGHVSTIIGAEPYEHFARHYGKPIAVSGFEPLDILQSVLMLVRQLNEGRAEVENQFTRTVGHGGNAKAKAMVDTVMETLPRFDWRGLGTLPDSALRLRDAYARFDAERRFAVESLSIPDHKACACGDILRGLKKPQDCRIFGTACTPESPVGSCMVSPEGSCAAHYAYGRLRSPAARTPIPAEA